MPAVYDQLSDDALDAVLDAFYEKVRRDPALGPVFARAIADHEWPEHLRVIRDFWSSVMLKTGRYKGNPFAAHLTVEGISPALFGAGWPCSRRSAASASPPRSRRSCTGGP